MNASALVLSVFALLAMLNISESRLCDTTTECARAVRTYWATDGTTCVPLPSYCEFKKVNCARAAVKLIALKPISEKRCQDMCNKVCDFEVNPVCGVLDSESVIFTSPCAMYNAICKTGKLYTVTNMERCNVQVDRQIVQYV